MKNKLKALLCSLYFFLWVYFEGFFHCTSIFFFLFPIIKFEFGSVCEFEVAELMIVSSGFLK